MSVKRILIVDDSSLFQRILTEVINARDGLEVVAVAANGQIALGMMKQFKPDLVTLDILMPELDGIQTLMAIKKNYPSVKTIMVSSLTSQNSDAALDALTLGADEYAVKPSSVRGIAKVRSDLTSDLLPKIEALFGMTTSSAATRSPSTTYKSSVQQDKVAATSVSSRSVSASKIQLIAIGVSTGGPDALTRLLSELSGDIGVPIVIVQHMPAAFTYKLAKRLNAASVLRVVEAQQGDKICSGTVYIAPGDQHMTLERKGSDVITNLDQEEPENSCRPSVDPLFRSIPAIYGSQCLGVIMTGMGADGLRGCEALAAANCPIIVQDKATSIVWGMPKLVATAGLAREQVPLDRMADVITAWVKQPSKADSVGNVNSANHKFTTISGRCA